MMAVFPALFGLLMATMVTGDPSFTITPTEAVRRVGGELFVECKVAYQINSCRIKVGYQSYILSPSEQNQADDIVYHGGGLEKGECGAHIRRIKEEWNGNITCTLPPRTGNVEISRSMRLVVARPPGAIRLESTQQPAFNEGDKFMAQCIVPDGRPAAKITWFLDENPVFEGIHQPIITGETNDLQTISQNISRILVADDNAKTLICRAEHEALDQPREAKRQILVQYPPQRLEQGTITIFGLKLGAEGRLNVTIRANPAPDVEWTFGDQKIVASENSELSNVNALEPLHLGNGYYNITLILYRIKKEDVDRKYYLRVTNELGNEEFVVLISTMDEPAARKAKSSFLIIDVYGVELDTGAIVGIVIAVLVLLIAVSLIVFAKATGRWCFAGSRARDHTKSSGESTPAGDVLLEAGLPVPSRTDTESAVGGRERSRLAGLSARVRAALPRAKDKVQATESHAAETEEKPLSEEKKGVVYAELALGDQASTEKPPPPSAEYAEIVYTDQPKETKE
ncbi:fasciclin-3-like isoform X3 [Galleria mellonella]|uniref:Fasciclin-3-like isoform X3 n=1 Tax=Galleria mellonella TaxID=7137 RepID=A0ABM3MDB9_GALME|nr:fasciclin-3-like isoform X3 [Galleria mellonella]